jgi:hypothetical protein
MFQNSMTSHSDEQWQNMKTAKNVIIYDFKILCTLWESIVMNKYSPQDFTADFVGL